MTNPEIGKLQPAVWDAIEVVENTGFFNEDNEDNKKPLDKTTRLVNYFYEHLWFKLIATSATLGGGYMGIIMFNASPAYENQILNLGTKLLTATAGGVGGVIIGAGLGLVGGIGIGAAMATWKDMARVANRYIL